MAGFFRPSGIDQIRLLPEDPRRWLPEGHLAYFVLDVVAELDVQPILGAYPGGRGPAGYDPRMLLSVLLYGYCTGVFSSRKIAARCETDIAFRVLAGGQLPDFRTVADYRQRHLSTFGKLFVDVLRLCREAGLVKLGHVAIDGSKYQANASKHKAMSYGRMVEAEADLRAEVDEMLRQARETDATEDGLHGPGRRGDELPAELIRREDRLAKIREAKARLEERARERTRQRLEEHGKTAEEIADLVRDVVPGPKEQMNFTDHESRILKTTNGWVQGYNAQIAVDAAGGVIVATEVNAQTADSPRLVPVIDLVRENARAVGEYAEGYPTKVSADAGYCSEANLTHVADRGIDGYIATGRERHRGDGITGRAPRSPKRAAMREKLRTVDGKAIYAQRKAIVEPVHGQIKAAMGFRQFLLRGLEKVRGEFDLVALSYNLRTLWRVRTAASV
jgi:transposase